MRAGCFLLYRLKALTKDFPQISVLIPKALSSSHQPSPF
jgi:hypothetical protein